jgi:hypothetical protein
MVLCPPFPNKEQDTGPIILVIIILQKIRYTAKDPDIIESWRREFKKDSNNYKMVVTKWRQQKK